MNIAKKPFLHFSARLITTAALAASLQFAPGVLFAADRDAHEDQTELRIKEMHTKLQISPEQEVLWTKVAQIMLEEAKTMDSLTQTRFEHTREMTAVDDLKSYSEIAEAHANGLKKLTPAFADLYAGMSETQKKAADQLFREGVKKHKHKS